MKILILINTLGAGGAERSMVELAKFLKETEDISVKFICLERRKVGLEEKVRSLEIDTFYFEGNGGYRAKTAFLNKIIKQETPDIIHSVLAESNFILRFWKLFYNSGNCKIVQSLVNTPYSIERKKDSGLSWGKFQLAKQIDKWTARLTPNVFYHAITRTVLEHYRPLFNIKSNYQIIHRGRFENSYAGTCKKSDQFLIVNSGRQEFAKGQIDILKALKFLRDEKGITDIKFMLLGRQGGYSQRLSDFIMKNRLENQVEIPGFVDDVEKRIATAHAFVFPSYYEGLGGALIEAFSAKLPCACSNIAVLREVVGSKKGALFSTPGDYEALAGNILELYCSKKLREELGDYAFKRFQEAFRMEKINREMLEMYKYVIKEKS